MSQHAGSWSGGAVLITRSWSQRWQHAVKPDIGSESRFLPTVMGGPRRNIATAFDIKTRAVWLPDGENAEDNVYSFRQNSRTWQTYRHANGQKDIAWWHRPRLCIASRGKNELTYWVDSLTVDDSADHDVRVLYTWLYRNSIHCPSDHPGTDPLWRHWMWRHGAWSARRKRAAELDTSPLTSYKRRHYVLRHPHTSLYVCWFISLQDTTFVDTICLCVGVCVCVCVCVRFWCQFWMLIFLLLWRHFLDSAKYTCKKVLSIILKLSLETCSKTH